MVALLVDDGVAARRVKTTAITSRKRCHSFARQHQTEMTLGLLARKSQSKRSAPELTIFKPRPFASNALPLIRSIKRSPAHPSTVTSLKELHGVFT